MAILEIAAATGILYAGYKTRHQHADIQNKVATKNPENQNTPLLVFAQTRSYMTKLDDRYQTWIKTRLDPVFFGKKRKKQLDVLADKNIVSSSSALEQHINRRLGLGVTMLSTAMLNVFAVPTMLYITIGLAGYFLWHHAHEAYEDLIQQRKVTLNVVTTLYFSGMWLAGYFVFGSVILILFNLATKIRFVMENDSREKLHDIFGQQPRVALQVIDGVEIEIPTEQLHIGDQVVVNAGETLPVDGVITKGLALIDQQTLTGEAQPTEKQPGDTVFAGTLVLNGRVFVEVEKAGKETTATRIGEILVETAAHKTAIESKGLALADKGALPTLLVGVVAFPLFGLTGATAALGAGFGYNLRTVSILSMFNYLQVAAQQSILIKDARALEQLQAVDTFVFDKTGTLTQEIPAVGQIHRCQEHYDEQTLLIYAAAAEYRQTHPIAKAVIAAAETRNLALPSIEEASYEIGYGIKVTIDEQRVRVGSQRFMQLEGIEIPPSMQQVQTQCQDKSHSLVMVAVDEQLIGALELQASLRPEVKTVIADLRQRGFKLVILSGDQEAPTRALAQSLGIDDYFANTLPENKATLIEQLQNEGRVVSFIGDGVNDAIALQQADVGISLLGATTIATDAAQIVLMTQDLNKISELLNLAAQFDQTMRQGFWTTMIPGMICIFGVFLLHFGIIASEILFQLGFATGLGVAIKPLLDRAYSKNITH